MDSKLNARLGHYLEAVQNASPEAAADVCMRATADPSLFVFAELLNAPAIASLQNTPAQGAYQLLELFAHGTVADYSKNVDHLPPLTAAHKAKLRVLSLLSLARGRSRLPYDLVREALQLEDDAQVENVVRDAVYAGLVRARMNQRMRVVELSSSVGRDVVMPQGACEMTSMLRKWLLRTDDLIEQIDSKIAFIASETKLAAEHKALAAANASRARKLANRSESVSQRQSTLSDMNEEYQQFGARFSSSSRRTRS